MEHGEVTESGGAGMKTKVDVTSWVSIRVVTSVVSLSFVLVAGWWSMKSGMRDVQSEMTRLRRDVTTSMTIMARATSVASDDRHTAGAARAIWMKFGALNPTLVMPNVREIQRDNPPSPKALYIPMVEEHE